MKLKNKRTGEIGTLSAGAGTKYMILDENGVALGGYMYLKDLCLEWHDYDSLAELNEEWCDYEEQKGNWTIDPMNENYIDDGRYTAPDELERYEELGLKFNTEEEAEKAVEKLKALAEAKEDGLKIKGYYYNHEDLVILADIGKCNKLTLDELFGKEID